MIKLKIKGMTCQLCAETIKKALESVEGVSKVIVNFPEGYAFVEGNAKVEKLVEVVRICGTDKGHNYDVAEVEYEDILKIEHEKEDDQQKNEIRGKKIFVSKNNVVDLLIIGGGSAGFAAAIKAVELGAKPLIVEYRTIGGTCLNRGCVPSKFLIEAAKRYFLPSKNSFKGVEIERKSVKWKDIIALKESLLESMRKEKYWDVLEAYPEINYKCCRGEFIDGQKAIVGHEEFSFFKAIITTGSRPAIPPIKGIHKVRYHTSDSIFDIDHLPQNLIVVGGGAVGLELAQAFLRLGSKVTVLEVLPKIAYTEEDELSQKLEEILKKEGMEILTGINILSAFQDEHTIYLKFSKNGKEQTIEGSDILLATGRTPNTENLGLHKAGVEVNQKGFIKVNEFLQTTNPDIYSAGDCVGKMQLVTVAALEGAIAAENTLLGNKRKIDYSSIPHVIFTDPELASVGLTEKAAQEQGYDVDTRTLDLEKVPRARIAFETEGLVKIVLERKSGRILGIHVLMPYGGEVIHKAALLVKFSLKVSDVILMVDAYPTFSEAIKLCCQSFIKDVSKLSCCAE